jgi:hypothetical protein
MGRVKQTVRVDGSSQTAAVAVVGVVALGVVATLALVALVTVGLVVLGVVAVVGLAGTGGARYARYRSEAQAALALWRRDVRAAALQAPSEALSHAHLVQLADPPPPRVALAMRRLQADHADPRRADVTWRRP